MAQLVVSLLAALLSVQTRAVRQLQSWLMSRGQGASAAAGVATLVGGRNVEQILERARTSFYCVSATSLREQDVASQTPDPSLAVYAQRSSLGQADAFVSHSWSDNAKDKWVAMQRWRESFKRHHNGREPQIWMDKYCIDQDDIDNSLSCLPVYLAGCKRLLVLVGETYLNRLWCLVEIVTFLEMGGDLSNLDVQIIGSEESAANALASFDARSAQCTCEADMERLHAIFEVTGFDRISRAVTDMFSAVPSQAK
jgi:peptidoglycan hydrolase-like protein with peptidoglycan-binding domain